MAIVLGAGRGIDDSGPNYEEAKALAQHLRRKRVLGGGAREGDASPRERLAPPGREANVLTQGLGWGIGLGLGFWLTVALVFRQLL